MPPSHSMTRSSVSLIGCCLLLATTLPMSSESGLLRAAGPSPVAAPEDESRSGASDEDKRAARSRRLRDVKAAVVAKDVEGLDKVCREVARDGGARSLEALLSLLGRIPTSEDGLYWSLVGGIASFADEEALTELGRFLAKRLRKPVARDVLLALTRNPSPHVATTIGPLADGAPPSLQLLLVDKLGTLRSPQSVDALIGVLKREEARKPAAPTPLMLKAVRGLESITGERFGPSSVNWEGWWSAHRTAKLRGAKSGSRRSTGTAVDFLDDERDRVFRGVERAPPQRVVVLSAKFTRKFQWDFNKDNIESVLAAMRVPHTVVPREDFVDFGLGTTSAIVINCAQYLELCLCPKCKQGGKVAGKRAFRCVGCNEHHMHSARLDDEAVEKLRKFVLRGGYLFCEDWNVKELMPRLFPDVLAAGEQLQPVVVDVVPVRGAGTHPYLRGVFDPPKRVNYSVFGDEVVEEIGSSTRTVLYGGADLHTDPLPADIRHEWVIDDESFTLEVQDTRRVTTLLKSSRLRKLAGGHEAVAVAFRPGRGGRSNVAPGSNVPPGGAPGVVAVILSHFGRQQSQADEFALQNVLLNFLLDAHLQQQKIPGWAAKLEKEAKMLAEKKAAERKNRRRKSRSQKNP